MTKGKIGTLEWLEAHVGHSGNACLPWPFSRRWNGYGQVATNKKIGFPHRVMCQMAHGDPPTPKHVAAHSCHNGASGCVNPRHLSWVTASENILARRKTKKRWNNRGTITKEQAEQIVALKGKKNQREIASMFGISYQHVSVIQQGKLLKQRAA